MITTSHVLAMLLVCGIYVVLTVDGNVYMLHLTGSGMIYYWKIGLLAVAAVVGWSLYRFTEIPTVEIKKTKYIAMRGEPVKLECCASSFPSGTSVSWQCIARGEQNKILKIDQRKYEGSNSNNPHLVINEVTNDDEGLYVCTVSNWWKERKSAPTKLTVGDIPTVEIREANYTAVIGDQIELKCSVCAMPRITSVSWKHILTGGRTIQLTIDRRKYTGSSLNDPHLLINEITKDDEGEYVCSVSNLCGEGQSNSTKLTVKGVVATPQASSVVWTKEGSTSAIATDNDKYMGGVPQSPSLITIKIENNQDQGNYIRVATNAAGQENNSVKLSIDSNPSVRISDYCTPNESEDIEQRVKFVHAKMVNTLSDSIYPEAEEKWVKFTQLISAYVPQKYIEKHLQHIVGYLIQQEVIGYGKYDKLYEAVYEIDRPLSRITKEAESEIKTVRDGGMPGETPVEVTFIFAGTRRANTQPYTIDTTEQFPKLELGISGNISQVCYMDGTMNVADMTKDLPNRKLSWKEIGRISRYIGRKYMTFFIELNCPVELLEQEMDEHRHLAFRSRIAKIFIHLLKTKADTGLLAIADAMSRHEMDPAMLVNILSSNRNMTFTDEALPNGWLKTYLSINDVPIITKYIDIKLYFNLFLELGFTPRIVDDFDIQYKDKRTVEKVTDLLAAFINKTYPRPTINTILLGMRECDMDTGSLIRALKPT